MYTIQTVRHLTADILWMEVFAPRVAANCLPGQFLIVRLGEKGERIPLTICDYNRDAQTVTIVFQIVGASTAKMAGLRVGDAFDSVMGPLGNPSELTTEAPEALKKKKILFVAGGVGTAPIYPQVKYLHSLGVPCDCIIGARDKSLLILTEEMEALADNVYIATNDGSAGVKGLVTDVLKDLVVNQGKQYDLCIAIGPDDYDEILRPADTGTRHSDRGQPQPGYDGRHRYVRCMPDHRRRPGQVCLCRRPGV